MLSLGFVWRGNGEPGGHMEVVNAAAGDQVNPPVTYMHAVPLPSSPAIFPVPVLLQTSWTDPAHALQCRSCICTAVKLLSVHPCWLKALQPALHAFCLFPHSMLAELPPPFPPGYERKGVTNTV